MRKNKIILILALLFVTYQLPLTQAMETNNVTNLASLDSNGSYTSPGGLIYKKGGTVKDRLDHIKQHIPNYPGLNMAKINKKPLHSFYNMDLEAHDDIIDFIDTIYATFQSNEFNFNITTIPSGSSSTMSKNIVLHGKEYKVSVTNDTNSGNNLCRIYISPSVSEDPATKGYTSTGKRVDTTKVYGYKLIMNVAPATSKLPNEVQSCFPF